VSTADPTEGAAPDKRGFTEEELASVTQGPVGEAELDEVEAAEIDERTAEPESSFDKLVQKGKRLPLDRVKTVLESVLFVADRPLSLEELYEATGFSREMLEQGLNQVAAAYDEGTRGIVLHEVAGGYQLRTDPASAEYVRRFLQVRPQRLTRAAVETLAIIAYRQPVTRPELEDIRGVDCGAVVKALLDRKLIKILGKREEVGRPILYGTTREFLEYFALKDLSALPTLREFQELTQEHQEIVEREAPAPKGTIEALADPEFQKRVDEAARKSEDALAELESAMQTADATTKATAQVLDPKPPPPPEAPLPPSAARTPKES
jgi:segregation and condensation protein B